MDIHSNSDIAPSLQKTSSVHRLYKYKADIDRIIKEQINEEEGFKQQLICVQTLHEKRYQQLEEK